MNIKSLMKIRKERWVTGDIGLEIEVEGRNLPRIDNDLWKTTNDGSLQGEAYEYVLRRPLDLKGVHGALKNLDDRYRKSDTVVHDSVRAGVHVHINMQECTILQTYTFITLYLILEGLLVKWCGPTREGNLFCLRATDAEDLIDQLIRAAHGKDFRTRFYNDDLRYASVNVKALVEHGSLEFRAMRGTRNLDLVHKWADMLLSLRNASFAYSSPTEILDSYSGSNKEEFLTAVMGVHAKDLLCPAFEKYLFDGMRVMQDLVYKVNWESLASLKNTNPFDLNGDGDFEPLNIPVEGEELAVPTPPLRPIGAGINFQQVGVVNMARAHQVFQELNANDFRMVRNGDLATRNPENQG